MGLLSQPGLVRLGLFALLVGCSTTALMDSIDDDMGAPSSGDSVDPACSACFDTICAWQATECKADPGCATWLTCAQSSSQSGADWSDRCPSDLGPTAASLKDELVACIDLNDCCQAGDINYDGKEAGPDPSSIDGGPLGGGGSGGAYTAPDGSPEGWNCSGESCTCLACVQQAEACNFDECYSVHECKVFAIAFSDCIKTTKNADSPGDQSDLEACLFLPAVEAQASGGLQPFLDLVYLCLAGDCADYCSLLSSKSCAGCQQTRCLDELKSVLSDSNVVLGLWCRSYCQKNPEDGDCAPSEPGAPPAKCEGYLQDKMELLAPYLQCVQLSCGEEC